MLSGKLSKVRGIVMGAIKSLFAQLFGSAIGIIFMLVGTLGWAYWMWMAIKLGSFGMSFLESWDRSPWWRVSSDYGLCFSGYRTGCFRSPPISN
jgi:putative exporter of polyketide antibiotics